MKTLITFFISILVYTSTYSQNFEWARSMGGVYEDAGTFLNVDDNGNVYTTGGFSDSADFDPGPGSHKFGSLGSQDAFISKLDSAGNFVWAKQLGGAGGDIGFSVVVDQSDNVYAMGYFTGTAVFDPGGISYTFNNIPDGYIFLLKLDPSGNLIWAKQFGGTSGGIFEPRLAADHSNNLLIGGYFNGSPDFDPGPAMYSAPTNGTDDIFVCKLDSSGNFYWVKTIGSHDSEKLRDIKTDISGNIYFTGIFWDSTDFDPGLGTFYLYPVKYWDAFVCKLDTSGGLVWAKQMSGNGFEEGLSLALDPLNNVLVTGYFTDTADFNPGTGVFNLISVYSEEVFVSKLDSMGNFIWAKSFEGTDYERGVAVTADSFGNVFTTGFFRFDLDVDPGPGVHILLNAGGHVFFISKLDAGGNFVWAQRYGSKSNHSQYITVDKWNNVYTTGYFTHIVDFNPGGIPFLLSTSPSSLENVFVLKHSQLITGLHAHISDNFSLSPNPSSSIITLSNLNPATFYSISVKDVLGNTIITQKHKGSERVAVNVAALAAGVYFVMVEGDGTGVKKEMLVKKLVKAD